jgi:hypothetical protein
MSYEIPREIFKQKLLDRTNLCLIQVSSSNSNQEVPYKDIKTVESPINMDEFQKNYANKSMTYIVYGFDQFSAEAKKIADTIYSHGYPFVYFYQGNLSQDKVLDKGIN